MIHKKQKNEAADAGVITGSFRRENYFKKIAKHKRLAALIILIAVIASGIYMFISSTDKKDANTNKTQSTASTESNPEKSEETLKSDLSSAKPGADKAKVYVELSNLYVGNETNKTKATEYAQQAVKEDPIMESYAQLAFSAEKAGDYKTARDAYQKAATLAGDKAEDVARSDYGYYTAKQKEMESLL